MSFGQSSSLNWAAAGEFVSLCVCEEEKMITKQQIG